MANIPPTSKFEQSNLIAARKRELPRPAPSPAPPTLGAGRTGSFEQARQQANRREYRLQEIGVSFKQSRGKAKQGFDRVRER